MPTFTISTFSLHDALPIWTSSSFPPCSASPKPSNATESPSAPISVLTAALKSGRESSENGIASCAIQSSSVAYRSEEHTSELQSPCNLVCLLLLEKQKQIK